MAAWLIYPCLVCPCAGRRVLRGCMTDCRRQPGLQEETFVSMALLLWEIQQHSWFNTPGERLATVLLPGNARREYLPFNGHHT